MFLLDDISLENKQRFVAMCVERPVIDQHFVEHVEFAKVTQRIAGLNGRIKCFAETIKCRWAINGDFGIAGLAGEQMNVFLHGGA